VFCTVFFSNKSMAYTFQELVARLNSSSPNPQTTFQLSRDFSIVLAVDHSAVNRVELRDACGVVAEPVRQEVLGFIDSVYTEIDQAQIKVDSIEVSETTIVQKMGVVQSEIHQSVANISLLVDAVDVRDRTAVALANLNESLSFMRANETSAIEVKVHGQTAFDKILDAKNSLQALPLPPSVQHLNCYNKLDQVEQLIVGGFLPQAESILALFPQEIKDFEDTVSYVSTEHEFGKMIFVDPSNVLVPPLPDWQTKGRNFAGNPDTSDFQVLNPFAP